MESGSLAIFLYCPNHAPKFCGQAKNLPSFRPEIRLFPIFCTKLLYKPTDGDVILHSQG